MLNINKLQKAMDDGQYTKTKLCSATGIARTTLDAILNGSDAKISTVESLAKVLGVGVGYFFDEEVTIEQLNLGDGTTNIKGKVSRIDQRRRVVAPDAGYKDKFLEAQTEIIGLMKENRELRERIRELEDKVKGGIVELKKREE